MAEEKPVKQADDQELNDLLDSALKDFNEEEKEDKKEDTCKENACESTKDKIATPDTLEDAWSNGFVKQVTEQFEEDLQNFMQNGPDNELSASFQKMAQTVANAIKDEDILGKDGASTDFQSAVTRALNDLSATSENLQNEPDLSEMFGSTTLEGGPSGLLSFVAEMMQQLVSKEMLYPSLKELADKYPEWIEGKKETIPPQDLQKCTKQLELMRQMCSQLEKEEDGDTDETKKKRTETIISLMQEVQACGPLPAELIGEQTTLFQTDAERSMESLQNCCLM